jgi:hypothetical protein
VYEKLIPIATQEFPDIVTGAQLYYRRAAVPLKLRLFICDGTFVDVWLNPDGQRYAYHWEQRAVRGLIHRHDNAPDHPDTPTHPKHFHNGSEEAVSRSTLPDDPAAALRVFLTFVRERIEVDRT